MQLYPAEAVFVSVAGCGWISFRAFVPYSGYKFRGESKYTLLPIQLQAVRKCILQASYP